MAAATPRPHRRPRARHGWVPVLLTIVVLVALASILVAVGRDDEGGPYVAVVGDSVTYMSAGALDEELSWTGRTNVQGRPGFRTDELVPVAEEVVASGPDVLVLLTGYNDLLQEVDPDAGLRALVDVASQAPCAVWMLAPTKGDWDPEAMQAYEDRLVELASEVPTITVDPSWRDRVDATDGPEPAPDLVADDLVHLTEAGSRALAEAMEAAVRRACPTATG